MNPSIRLENLYREYKAAVLSYVCARVPSFEEAEDICEEAFLKLSRMLERYDEKRAALSTLLYKITHDLVIDHYRTRRTYEELSEEHSKEHSVIYSAEDIVMDNERSSELTDALSKLPEQQREILILRFYCGFSLKKIAEKMNLTYSMVVKRQNNAFETLRKTLKTR